MNEYYDLFVELSLQQCTKNDYANKLKVKTHNVASKKLRQLQTKMKKDSSEEMLLMLLNHDDDRVKINAAFCCLQMDVLIEQTVLALKKIIDESNDSTLCFSAKMLLQSIKN